MTFWAGEKVHLVIYPLRGGELYNLVAVFHSNRYEEGWDSFGDPAELHERFAKTCEPVRTLLGKIESWRMWVLCDRPPIKDWSRGRITLLGDAAHPMLQYLAQGACMAIEDAVCLANRVEAMQGDFAAAFQGYQAGALSAHRAGADHGARLWRVLSRERRRARIAQHDAVGARTAEQSFEAMEWLYGEDMSPTGYGRVFEREGERDRLGWVSAGTVHLGEIEDRCSAPCPPETSGPIDVGLRRTRVLRSRSRRQHACRALPNLRHHPASVSPTSCVSFSP